MPREIDADVAVVGAGLAGLAAARDIVGAGASTVVLEARERVGGRLVSEPIGGEQVEMGGQWVGPGQDRVLALAAELGIETFPTHTEGANLLELRGKLRRYTGTIPRLNPVALLDVARARRRLDRLAAQVDPAAPWAADDALELDGLSFAEWMRRRLRTDTARELIRVAGRTVWGAEPEDLSLLHVLFYVRSAGSFDALLDVEGGAQQDRFVGGSQLLASVLAERLGERVLTSAPVRLIAREGDRVIVGAGAGEAGGEPTVVRARHAILAVPPALLGAIEFQPALPALRRQLAQRMAGGWLVKTTATYAEPFWRANGLSGEAVSDQGPGTLTFDNSPPGASFGALVAFVGGSDARRFTALDEGERREALLAGLARLFGPRARSPERYLELDWAAERWSGGGPTANFATGGWTGPGRAIREPLGPIHFAGTETATAWAGYMDGAVSSGERAAADALAGL